MVLSQSPDGAVIVTRSAGGRSCSGEAPAHVSWRGQIRHTHVCVQHKRPSSHEVGERPAEKLHVNEVLMLFIGAIMEPRRRLTSVLVSLTRPGLRREPGPVRRRTLTLCFSQS